MQTTFIDMGNKRHSHDPCWAQYPSQHPHSRRSRKVAGSSIQPTLKNHRQRNNNIIIIVIIVAIAMVVVIATACNSNNYENDNNNNTNRCKCCNDKHNDVTIIIAICYPQLKVPSNPKATPDGRCAYHSSTQ